AWLQAQYPGRFADGQVRTLQRRIKQWRAVQGPAKEVFFTQVHEPGRLGASDFTHCSELGITIGGVSFPHLIYHFVLTYSNWETWSRAIISSSGRWTRRCCCAVAATSPAARTTQRFCGSCSPSATRDGRRG